MPSLWAFSSSPIISRVGSVKKSYDGGCITRLVEKEGETEEFATHAKKIAAGIRHDLAIELSNELTVLCPL